MVRNNFYFRVLHVAAELHNQCGVAEQAHDPVCNNIKYSLCFLLCFSERLQEIGHRSDALGVGADLLGKQDAFGNLVVQRGVGSAELFRQHLARIGN